MNRCEALYSSQESITKGNAPEPQIDNLKRFHILPHTMKGHKKGNHPRDYGCTEAFAKGTMDVSKAAGSAMPSVNKKLKKKSSSGY